MKNKITLLAAFFAFAGILSLAETKAQTAPAPATPAAPEAPSPFKVTADLVSHYVWRGSMATGSPTPNFQPTFSYTKGAIEIGVWGSTDFLGSYKEVDPFVSYTAGALKFTVTDYDWNFDRANYFNYKSNQTGHMIEGTVGYTGSASCPISVTWNTMFFGFDKKTKDNGDVVQAYSTYIELGYTAGPANLFFGFTPWESYYNNYGVTSFDLTASKKSFSIVNIGASVTKALKITDAFSLPIKTTLVINPSATYNRKDYIHLVFGITF